MEAPAAAVRERIGRWATVEESGPARCLVTITTADNLDWPVMALGVAGADFRVLSPPELADRVATGGAGSARPAGPGADPAATKTARYGTAERSATDPEGRAITVRDTVFRAQRRHSSAQRRH